MNWPHVVPLAFSAVLLVTGSGDAVAQQYFNGYLCTEDCSGHQAGYDWAEQNGVQDASDCGGNSQSFVEGCETYVEENQNNTDEDAEDDEEGDGEASDGY